MLGHEFAIELHRSATPISHVLYFILPIVDAYARCFDHFVCWNPSCFGHQRLLRLLGYRGDPLSPVFTSLHQSSPVFTSLWPAVEVVLCRRNMTSAGVILPI
jgi:hypothetical protein